MPSNDKRRALEAAGLAPVQLTAYERVKYARTAPATDNGRRVVRARASR